MTSPDTVGSETWKKILVSGASDMGIGVTDLQVEQCAKFAILLSEWNRQVNLTSITDPEGIAVKHFLDSMAVLPYLPENGRLLDIGSGGGFPGLVLAIFRPLLLVTSIDSVRKKVSFQQHMIRVLGLHGAKAVHTRAEDLKDPATPSSSQKYDVIVSRALGSLEMFASLALPLLAPGGTLVAYKGDREDTDQTETEFSFGGRMIPAEKKSYQLPRTLDKRSLIFLKPDGSPSPEKSRSPNPNQNAAPEQIRSETTTRRP